MIRTMTITNNARSLSLAAALAVAALTAPFSASVAIAQDAAATPANSAAVSQLDALSTVMRNVGKAVEPSVVSIEVEKMVTAGVGMRGQIDEEMLKRFFPDADGDGSADLPEGFKLPGMPENGEEGEEPRQRLQMGEGSGVILDATADKAYVLTNNHVAGDASKLTITLWDGRKVEDVKVIGTDPLSDLALLEVNSPNLQAIKWADSDTVAKGDIVLAFGSPFGYVGSMTQGIVSGKNRTTNPMGGPGLLGQGAYEYFIQTDCAINPGNSGGPLVNVRGELVGINTAIASRSGAFSGIGFAVPSNLARFVYDQLKAEGKVTRGFLGVKIASTSILPKKQVAQLDIDDRRGVFVSTVTRESPAAGKLEVNDVITAVNGEPITTSEELRLKVSFTKPGNEVKLTVLRDGKETLVPVAVGTFPDPTQTAAANKRAEPAAPSATEMGAALADANTARLKSAGLPEDAKGALVTSLKSGSLAQMSGLVVGDLITKVNDQDVTSAAEALAAIKAAKLTEGISLMVINKEGTKSVFVQAEE